MKKGLMVVSLPEPEINIGDYVQALAAKQFIGQPDYLVERERLDEYAGEPIKMIMNGWYMHQPEHFPADTKEKITPLWVSFHLNELAKSILDKPSNIEYLKQHEPIGCRDKWTAELLKSKGIDAYFSGCLTLTLGNTYASEQKDDKVYFVDPIIEGCRGKKRKLSALIYLLTHYKAVRQLFPMFRGYSKRYNCLFAAAFHRDYSKVFDEKMFRNAEIIKHQTLQIRQQYPTNEALLSHADSLLKRYARAKCVVTSRIHCALPCLSLQTPVIYLDKKKDSILSKCRLDGLLQLFNVVSVAGGG